MEMAGLILSVCDYEGLFDAETDGNGLPLDRNAFSI